MGESNTQDTLFNAYVGLVHSIFTKGTKTYAAHMREHPRKPGEPSPEPKDISGEDWEFQQLPYLKPVLLDRLKGEYGDNPCFWQLCFWNASHWRESQELGIKHFNPEPFRYLTQSLEMGLEDPATYLLLQPVFETAAEKFLEDGANMLCGHVEFSDPSRTAAAKEIAGEEVAALNALAKELVNKIGMSELEMLDKVVELAPEASGSWYSRGVYCALHRELEKGLEDIRNGNMAQDNNNLIGFPHIALSSQAYGTSEPKKAVVLGMLSIYARMEIAHGSQRVFTLHQLREILPTLNSEREKIAVINAWTKMVIRGALAEPREEGLVMLAISMAARYFTKVAEKSSKQFSKSSRSKILQTTSNALNAVHAHMRQKSMDIGVIDDDPVDEQSGLLSDEEMLEYLSKLWLGYSDRVNTDCELINNSWLPLIRSLEEIDLEELMEP